MTIAKYIHVTIFHSITLPGFDLFFSNWVVCRIVGAATPLINHCKLLHITSFLCHLILMITFSL